MAKGAHRAIFSFVILSLFTLREGSNNITRGEDKISAQGPVQGRDGKYLTPCIKSVICNDGGGIHLGNCWCCIFKGKCYSSEFICTLLCLIPPDSASNKTSNVP